MRYIYVFVLILFLSGCAKKESHISIWVDARAAVILDAQNGEVLFEKRPDVKLPPASTTKIMTAVIAVERLPLHKEVMAGKVAVHVEPTVAGLRAGVKYKLEDLIAAILIKSANDASRVIAEAVAGSEKEFAALMNEKAKELGMENTYFATSTGLPVRMGKKRKDMQHTTAMDLAVLMRYAARYPIILESMSQKEKNIYGNDGRRIYLKTHNRTLFQRLDAPWGKTGYTIEAKRTFAGVNSSMKPEIVFSLLKSDNLWGDILQLNDKGLRLYKESRRNFISDIIEWIREQKKIGRERVRDVMAQAGILALEL